MGFSGDGHAPTSAELNLPVGVVVDGAGDLFIADSGNNRIREVNAGTQNISTFAGNGTQGYSGNTGAAINAELYDPTGLAFDNQGDLFIADTNNNVIRKVNALTGVITTVAGDGVKGWSGDHGPATNATLALPNGVAWDSQGHLYIADTGNNVIRRVAFPQLAFTTNPMTITAGTDSGTITVQVEDENGNPVSESGDVIDLSSSSGTGKFYANAGSNTPITTVTTGSGGSASFVYEDTVAGNPTLTATDTSNVNLLSGVQKETVVAGPAATITITTSPQVLMAGTESGDITFTVTDANGNVVGNELIDLSSSAGTGLFYADSSSTSSITSITTDSTGTASFVYYDTTGGTPIVTIKDDAHQSVLQTQQETVTAGAVATVAFTTNPMTLKAGVDSGTITVKAADSYGNGVSGELIDLTTSSSTGVFYANSGSMSPIASVTTTSNGTASFVYYDTVVGTPSLTAADDATPTIQQTQQETVTAGNPVSITFTTNPQSVTAGMDSGTITVSVVDQFGNAVGGELIDLSSSAGTGKFYANAGNTTPITSVTTTSSGTADFLYYDTTAGTPTVTATDTTNTAIQQTQQETVTAGAVASISFTTTPMTLKAGTDSGTITVKAADTYGNAISNELIDLGTARQAASSTRTPATLPRSRA